MAPKALPSAKINSTKLLGGSSFATKKISVGALQNDTITISKKNLVVIKTQVIKIKDLVKSSTLLKSAEIEKKRKESERQRFSKKEQELEKPQNKEEGGKEKISSLPKLGFLDRIKKFFFNVLLGYVVVKLLPHVNKLPDIVKTVGSAIDFGTDLALGLFNGLVTFVDWGYKAYDATRGFIKTIGGNNTLKVFDAFNGGVGKLIDAAIIAAMAIGEMSGGGGGGKGPKRGFDKFGRRVGTKAQERYLQRHGEKQFAERFGEKGLQRIATKGAESTVERGLLRTLVKRIPIVGALLDFALNYFVFHEPLGESAFRAIGSTLFGFIGGAIGSIPILIPFGGPLIGAALGGLAGDSLASVLYDMIFKNKKPTTQKTTKSATGGPVTRGGKVQGSVKRTVKKAKRSVKVQPPQIKPGAAIGGEEKIAKVFPESKDRSKVNPLGYMKKSYDTLASTSGFGGLFGLALKAQLGEKPSDLDYKIAASALSAWMENNIATGGAFAEGGSVDVGMFSNSEDMKNMIAKSLQDTVSSKIDDTINDLMKQMMLKPAEGGKAGGGKENPDGDLPAGSGTLTGNTNAEKVFNYLIGYGFTPQAAAGVVGNLMQESGVNPNSNQGGGGAGRGIMQWGTGAGSGQRWDALTAWAQASGKNPRSLDTQVEWMMKEMTQRGTIKRLKGLANVKAATDLFEKEMEGAGTPMMENRYKYAADALASFGGGSAGGPGIPLGKGYGSEGSKIAGELGRFIQQKLKSPQQYQAITEHPEFGGVTPGAHASGGYHYQGGGRAVDIGAYAYEQGPILKVIAQFNQMKGVKPVELLKAGDPGHYNHVHVAYAKGGLISSLTHAMIGERGPEFVFDNDTTSGLRQSAPGLLERLNMAKTKPQLMSILRSYAGYESGAEKVVEVPSAYSQPVVVHVPVPMGGGGMSGGMNGGSSDSSYDSLYM